MYENKELKNKSLDSKEKDFLFDYIQNNINNSQNHRHQFIDLSSLEAKCACSELILYHLYFFCKKTTILGFDRSYNTTSNQVTINDLYYPFGSWNANVIRRGLTIKSGATYFTIHLEKVERVVGLFKEFNIILPGAIVKFKFGEIFFESRTDNSSTGIDIDNYYCLCKERKPISRYLRLIDRRNYNDFAFYLNDNFLYKDFKAMNYFSFDSYKDFNSDLLNSQDSNIF